VMVTYIDDQGQVLLVCIICEVRTDSPAGCGARSVDSFWGRGNRSHRCCLAFFFFIGIDLVVSGVAQVIFAFSLPVFRAIRSCCSLAARHRCTGGALLPPLWRGLSILLLPFGYRWSGSSFGASQRPVAAIVNPRCPGRGMAIVFASRRPSRSSPASSCWRIVDRSSQLTLVNVWLIVRRGDGEFLPFVWDPHADQKKLQQFKDTAASLSRNSFLP